MSQSPDNTTDNIHPDFDTQTIEKLRQFRELMTHRFNEHTAGNTPLPPEQSLSLRTNISNITKMIEPGTQEIWPDFTAAEKSYIADQNEKSKLAGNDLSIAFLGPMASPAILAKTLNAPSDTVDKLLEFGFGMTAMAGLASVGRGAANVRGVIKPVTIAEGTHGNRPSKPQAIDSENVTYTPEASKNKLMQNIMQSVDEVKPILNWYKAGRDSAVGKFDTGRLAVLIERYGGEDAKIIAELGSEESIDTLTKNFGKAGNFFDAVEHGHRFQLEFIEAISKNGNVDPVKLAHTLSEIKDGNFVTASDFAALEYARNASHKNYVKVSASDALGMARIAGMTNEADLRAIEMHAKLIAEKNSPYQITKNTNNEIPPPDQGLER